MIRKILVPIDFSPASQEALDYATDFAKLVKAELVVLHVVETIQYATPADLFGAAANLGMLEQEQRRIAQRELARVEAGLRKRGLKVKALLGTGSPASTIIDTAKRTKADAIVMATHGRTGLTHILMGSVAERVVRTAGCPVLTLHPKKKGARRSRRTTKRPATRRRPRGAASRKRKTKS